MRNKYPGCFIHISYYIIITDTVADNKYVAFLDNQTFVVDQVALINDNDK